MYKHDCYPIIRRWRYLVATYGETGRRNEKKNGTRKENVMSTRMLEVSLLQ